jgi:hypothetical protein
VSRLFAPQAGTAVVRVSASKLVVVATGRLRLRVGGQGTLTLHPRRELPARKLSLVTRAAGTPVERTTRVSLN